MIILFRKVLIKKAMKISQDIFEDKSINSNNTNNFSH